MNNTIKKIVRTVIVVGIVFAAYTFWRSFNTNFADNIFYGGPILTMEGNIPQYAEAVAIRADKVLFVGSKDEALQHKGDKTELIDLQGKTMLPGLIDPHLHPAAIAFYYYARVIRADDDWGLPGLTTIPVTTPKGYKNALKKADAELSDPNAPLVTIGYASYYHGKIGRAYLDQISQARPIIVFQRSFHEAYLNGKALQTLGFTAENTQSDPTIDLANGHFVEASVLETLAPRLAGMIMVGDHWQKTLRNAMDYLHHNGVTTIMDPLAFDGGTPDQQRQFREIFDAPDATLRTYMVAEPRTAFEKGGADAATAYIDNLVKKSGRHLIYMNAIKGFVDGAFFAQLMRLTGGYTDGHQGVWITPPDELKKIVTAFWNKGSMIHLHVNGDDGLDAILAIMADIRKQNPESASRVVFHHLGFVRPEQVLRMKAMGIHASILPYYLHALGDIYSTHGLGPERASHISREAAFVRAGIITSLHSDFFMGPSKPLYSAWCAVTRIGVASGKVLGPEDRLTPYQALRAVTTDAAFTLGLENGIGSIAPGKKADFVILAEDPLKVDPMHLKDIRIIGKVFEGKQYTLNR